MLRKYITKMSVSNNVSCRALDLFLQDMECNELSQYGEVYVICGSYATERRKCMGLSLSALQPLLYHEEMQVSAGV